ncbi:MAG: phytanoyl-CoA dioxygenase family protein [bacterium]|jgi:ectoine hydroxylase-related dioxygenase (phytanoyl-CoA dioxygenase family)
MENIYSSNYLEEYRKKGYTILRGFLSPKEVGELAAAIDEVKAEGMQHPASFRHQNLLFLIQPDPELGKVLRFCQWPSYSRPLFEKYRTDRRFYELLSPLLGENIKQIINQIIWKTPGSHQTTYGYHQDARFRRPESAYRQIDVSYIQTAIAIDPHTVENGCMTFIEGSHLMGNLKYHTSKSVLQEHISDEVLEQLGMRHLEKVDILLEPGDLAIWHPFLLHGSRANRSGYDRRAYVNGYVKAENCDRGEWTFRKGQPVPLSEPVLVQFEDLFERPEPHYIQGAPYPVKKKT